MLLCAFQTVSLASYSKALTLYDSFCTNQLDLAGFVGLDYLAALDFWHLTHYTGLGFRFLLSIAGIEPTDDSLKQLLPLPFGYIATYCDVLAQLLHTLLDTEYNTPSCLLPCGLLSISTSLGLLDLQLLKWYFAFPREWSDWYLPVSRWHSLLWLVTGMSANSITSHRLALMLSFRTYNATYCLPPS